MNKSIITIDGRHFILYINPVFDGHKAKNFEVIAFEEISKDCMGQKYMHPLLDQALNNQQEKV